MTALFRVATFAVVLVTALMQHAQAANMLSLSSVARAYGFVYATESMEVAAHLSRPGLSLLVRAGDPRYQVNDDTQYLSQAPAFRGNQIFVDSSFESVLARLAEAHPWPGSSAMPPVVFTPYNAPPGAKLTIAAHYIDTTQTIAASGKGPAGAPIDVVIKAALSRDIPAITVAHSTVFAAADGSYRAVLSVLSLTFPNTFLQIAATAGPNVIPAATTLELGPPNPRLDTPNDKLPDN